MQELDAESQVVRESEFRIIGRCTEYDCRKEALGKTGDLHVDCNDVPSWMRENESGSIWGL
jgi:hypothetical protein